MGSSSRFSLTGANANNGNWLDRWLPETPGSNPGDDYLLTLNYHGYAGGITMNAIDLIFGEQKDYSDLPATWEIILKQEGDVETSLGMFNGEYRRGLYSYYLGQTYTGVTQMVLRVPEANNQISQGIAVYQFGAFFIPEPYTLLLVLSGVGALALRRALRQHRHN